MLNGEETDIDCGGPDCEPCAENRRCENHRDCAGLLCLREYDPFPIQPCFARSVEDNQVFFPEKGKSLPTPVGFPTSSQECEEKGGFAYNYCQDTDIHYCCGVCEDIATCVSNGNLYNCGCPKAALEWQVRGGPNCRVTFFDEFGKPAIVSPGNYVIGSEAQQAFPRKVTAVLVEMSSCAYLDERTGDACSKMNGCQWCDATSMCLDARAVAEGACPSRIWDPDMPIESSPYYVGYNPARGQGSFGSEKGYCQGSYERRWQVRMDQGLASQCEQTEYTGGDLGERTRSLRVPGEAVSATSTQPQSMVLDWQNIAGVWLECTPCCSFFGMFLLDLLFLLM